MKKADITGVIDRRSEWLFSLSDAIWDHPELAFHETYAANLLCDALRKEGFTVEEGVAGIPTAFLGRFGEGKPVIGILGEYDALAGMSRKADVTHAEPIINDATDPFGASEGLFTRESASRYGNLFWLSGRGRRQW